MESIAVPDVKPDLTFVLDLPADAGLQRTQNRHHGETRFERFDLNFHERLRVAFREIADKNPDRCVLIDATREKEQVAAEIIKIAGQRFGI